MKIAVGSKNPAKIKSVQKAFAKVFPNEIIEIEGVNVESDVSNQPMSDKESIQGARNRAIKAKNKLGTKYGVGLEGGIQEIDSKWFNCGWIVVVNEENKEGIGSTIKIELSEKLMKLILEGKELGEASDVIFGTVNSKHREGHFGLMTKNAITRTNGYRDGVISALSRFIQPKIFE